MSKTHLSPCIKKNLNILKYLINKFTQDPIHLKSSLHRISNWWKLIAWKSLMKRQYIYGGLPSPDSERGKKLSFINFTTSDMQRRGQIKWSVHVLSLSSSTTNLDTQSCCNASKFLGLRCPVALPFLIVIDSHLQIYTKHTQVACCFATCNYVCYIFNKSSSVGPTPSKKPKLSKLHLKICRWPWSWSWLLH